MSSSAFPGGAPGRPELPDPAKVPMRAQVFIRVTDPTGGKHLAAGDPALARRLVWDEAARHRRGDALTLGRFRELHPGHRFREEDPASPKKTVEADFSAVSHLPDDSVVEVCIMLTPVGGPIPVRRQA